MKLYKREKDGIIWWMDTTIDGQRYRLSLDTTDWREARNIAKQKTREILEGKVTATSVSFAKLKFDDACHRFLEDRKLELQPSTYIKEKQVTVRLREFFKGKRLCEISAEMVQEYRKWRAANGMKNSTINMEYGFLRRLLKKAHLWHRMSEELKPLKESRSIGRALSEEEIVRLRITAAKRPEWQTAFDAMILAINTGMRGADIKALRWRDIEFFNKVLNAKSKTEAGERTIPLTDEALKTLLGIKDRAAMFGEVLPLHYVFASHKVASAFNGNQIVETKHFQFNPTQPIKSWRTAWRTLTKEAGLKGLRFHDLRHTVITKLLESGAPEWVIMAIVGHVDRRMLDRYGHIRMQAKRAAIEYLSHSTVPSDKVVKEEKSEGYVTIHVTNEPPIPVYSDLNVAMIEGEEIGTCGFEPQTPTVSR